jgi:hypothetical protein
LKKCSDILISFVVEAISCLQKICTRVND